jgi:predicted nucleic acid-binding protein
VVQGVLEPEDVTQGIQSLRMDPEITVVPFIGTQVQNTSYVLRRTLNDYIDCLILSTAMNEADMLLTEDRTIQGFMEDESIRGLAHAIAPDFRVLNYDQLRAVTS